MEAGRPYTRLLRRLDSIVSLAESDRYAITRLPMTVKNCANGQDVAREGDISTQCILVLDGYLFRHKLANGSQRQIMSFHVPGDIPDLQTLHLPKLDHTVTALGGTVIAFIPHAAFKDMLEGSPRLTHVFWRESLVDAAIFREWVINGRRDAISRVAHMICELMVRLQAVGLARDMAFTIPWTQSDVADAAGISTVHTNRVIQELRRLGLLEWDSRLIQIRNWEGLATLGDFSDDYLHLRKSEATSVASALS
ncbi:cyclic nucleotide-binding protein [Afipia carboxidovorans OM5]|uniref:Transcriptional regulator, Crp family protein n=1 Tax=Afipia carboxidovorans (strain ATCC 49405 / DSM 1227 / KCTC 32145 / OM5) TaxID=504832 RepID=B6JGP5_AFIC5|nr:cyclic nucleotide-binding protein [Afipia carboxidovorans OM5]AEI02478.1 transcriptional regulator, Crp family protein [Afipia carboxidovorans OM4]AEI06054.1 transcriptional regulator, Crp family protein [Afipia carboxidovorans OM5]BEV46845.1 Crp/Fnr family transcriptional regulator [Afipia carboxidovorans]